MEGTEPKRILVSKGLIRKLEDKLREVGEVVAFIVYGSYSNQSDHTPTEYSDIDLEIVVRDEFYETFLDSFKPWFEKQVDLILIETSVSHLQKIFVTRDFINLEFHVSVLSDFDKIDKRELNYFPNGYTILFDKTNTLDQKIHNSIKPTENTSIQEKFDKLNSSFWFFVQSTAPFIQREEYWFAAAGYWVWLYMKLCTLLRMYENKEVKYNPMKHIETALNPRILKEIQPLRNLESVEDLKKKMTMAMNIYAKYCDKIAEEKSLNYDVKLQNKVMIYVNQYL